MYRYFISYSYVIGGTGSGFGNTETHCSKMIEGIDDINSISRRLERDLGYDENSLVIINYIELK